MDYVSDIRLIHTRPWRIYLRHWFAFSIMVYGRILFHNVFRRVRPVEMINSSSKPVYFMHGPCDAIT